MSWRSAGSVQPQHWHSRRAEYFQRIRKFAGKKKFLWRFTDKFPYRHWGEGQQNLHDLCAPGRLRSRNFGGPIVVEQGVRAGEMAELVSRIGHDGRIRHVRDHQYLSWRYRNPLHRYLFLYWKEKDLEGYLVLQQYVSEYSPSMVRVNIVDWEATSLRVRAGLLRAATRLTPFADLNIWTSTLGNGTKKLLRDVGFGPVQEVASMDQEQPCLLVRSVRADEPAAGWSLGNRRLQDMADWDIRMIYSMQG